MTEYCEVKDCALWLWASRQLGTVSIILMARHSDAYFGTGGAYYYDISELVLHAMQYSAGNLSDKIMSNGESRYTAEVCLHS